MSEWTVRGGVIDAIVLTSSEVTPNRRPIMQKMEPAGSPSRVEDKAIELFFESDRSHPRTDELVAKSGPIVEQVVEVDAGTIAEGGQIEGEAGGRESPMDRVPKRLRVEANASGSKSPPRIIPDPSERLQEVLVVFHFFLKGMKVSLNHMVHDLRGN